MFLTSKKKIFPGFGISLGSSLLFTCLILLLPLSVLLMQVSKMTFIQYWKVISNPQVISAYKITLLSATISSFFNALFGMIIAWILTRYKFPGRNIIDGLIDLPFALPTAVAGLTLSKLFSINGFYGSILNIFNIKISYTFIGIIIAMAFTSIPFVVRTIQPVLEEISKEYEETAQILGANQWKTFYRIILPEIMPSLVTGTALSFTRSLGEFGAVIFIASNIAWKTEVISLVIFIKIQEFDYVSASAISSVVLFFSLLLLFCINIIQNRYSMRLGN